METKINLVAYFFQLKSQNPQMKKSFDQSLCNLGIHQDVKNAKKTKSSSQLFH
jgi:hypothetical protein